MEEYLPKFFTGYFLEGPSSPPFQGFNISSFQGLGLGTFSSCEFEFSFSTFGFGVGLQCKC